MSWAILGALLGRRKDIRGRWAANLNKVFRLARSIIPTLLSYFWLFGKMLTFREAGWKIYSGKISIGLNLAPHKKFWKGFHRSKVEKLVAKNKKTKMSVLEVESRVSAVFLLKLLNNGAHVRGNNKLLRAVLRPRKVARPPRQYKMLRSNLWGKGITAKITHALFHWKGRARPDTLKVFSQTH